MPSLRSAVAWLFALYAAQPQVYPSDIERSSKENVAVAHFVEASNLIIDPGAWEAGGVMKSEAWGAGPNWRSSVPEGYGDKVPLPPDLSLRQVYAPTYRLRTAVGRRASPSTCGALRQWASWWPACGVQQRACALSTAVVATLAEPAMWPYGTPGVEQARHRRGRSHRRPSLGAPPPVCDP